MNTFALVDFNEPEKTILNCTGVTVVRNKKGQLIIYTSGGQCMEVGIQMEYPLCVLACRKIGERALKGETVTLPDFSEMDDDQIRIAIEDL